MRKLTFAMNRSLDGYIAASGDDLGWSVPGDELFQWWSDRVGATGLALYGRKLWQTMSSHWPTADQQPGATPAQIEFARRWRDMPKVVFSSTTSAVDWNARLVTGDAVTEITRLKTEDGGPMDVGGAALADVPGVAEAYSVTGEFDFVAILRVKNHEEIADIVTSRLSQVAGIRKTYTHVAFKVYSKHDLEAMFSVGLQEAR